MTTVFFDVDTQIDFLYPAGALYVPGAERIIPVVAKLNRYAAAHSLPLISTADAHAESDPEFRQWPGHCIAGTFGAQKPAATLLEPRIAISCAGPVKDFPAAKQFILEKQHNDAFTNPNLKPLLATLDAARYVVYGVVTEICVQWAALGLLETGARVELVSDAVRSLNDDASRAFLDEFQSRGGAVTASAAVAA